MNINLKTAVDELGKVSQALLRDEAQVTQVAELLTDCLRRKGKVLVAGNGGSAADAQHFVAELVNRFRKERMGLAGIDLTSCAPNITAIANDYAWRQVFAKQLEALASPGDIFVGISTSGNSENILVALAMAKRLGCSTIGLTGQTGGKMVSLCNYCIRVQSTVTARIQEVHGLLIHVLCGFIEDSLFPINPDVEILKGYDFDGVVSRGIVPDKGSPIISGRSFQEVERVSVPGCPIYFNPKSYREKNDQNSAEWKAAIINQIGIGEFYEDNIAQITILRRLCPNCTIVHTGE
jgi:D-sedoheptulose 7-phosphate isomerase